MLVLAGANDSLPHSGAGCRWSRRTRSCHIRARDRVWAGAVVQSGVFGGGKRRLAVQTARRRPFKGYELEDCSTPVLQSPANRT